MALLTGRTPLVGRRVELALIAERLGAGAEGAGSALLIAGEAGIGKSRLVAEARHQAAQHGFQQLCGVCFEGDRSLPFAPWLDLLRSFVHEQSEASLLVAFRAVAAEICALLPELASRLPEHAPIAIDEPEQHKRLLFHALARFIGDLAREQPMLLVLEDLHWADDTSLELMPYLLRQLIGHPIGILLTYRSDAIHPALAQMLAEVNRGRLALDLALAPLGMGDVEAMLRALLGQEDPVRADLFARVYELTEGNPFFVEEVARSLPAAVAAGKPLPIPGSVAEAVRLRTTRISAAARELLSYAAVAGRRFDLTVLQDLAGCEEGALIEILKELIAAQFVVEESADRFTFRHALTRAAVYASLLARERRSLHARLLLALERHGARGSGGDAADLAYHAVGAELWSQVALYAARAGEHARTLHAPRAAVEQFTLALDAARRLGVRPPSATVLARGRAYRLLGDFDPAREDFELAAALARAEGDVREEWQALLDLGFLWASRDYTRAGECFHAALALARTLDDPVALAQSLNRIGNWHGNLERPREALALHQEALAIFRSSGDTVGVAETLDLLGITTIFLGDLQAAAAYLDEALAGLRTRDDREGLATTLTMRLATGPNFEMVTVVPAADDPQSLLAIGTQALAMARSAGQRSGEAFALFGLAMSWGVLGRYAEALPAAREALGIAREIEHAQWLAGAGFALGNLLLDLLLPAAARPVLEQALTQALATGSINWIRLTSASLAVACLRCGDTERAATVLDEALGAEAAMQTVSQRLVWSARAELELRRGAAGTALTIVERLLASAPARMRDADVPFLAWQRAEALARLQRPDEALVALYEAEEGASRLGLRPLLWRIQAARGHLFVGQGRRRAAMAAFAAARVLIDAVAVDMPDEPFDATGVPSLRAHYNEAAAAQLPRLRPPTPMQTAKRAHGGLTAREREVALLVAAGRSNREIAAALVLGERTVEFHISNILAKLNASSRAQIAAWAVAQQLAGPEAATPRR